MNLRELSLASNVELEARLAAIERALSAADARAVRAEQSAQDAAQRSRPAWFSKQDDEERDFRCTLPSGTGGTPTNQVHVAAGHIIGGCKGYEWWPSFGQTQLVTCSQPSTTYLIYMLTECNILDGAFDSSNNSTLAAISEASFASVPVIEGAAYTIIAAAKTSASGVITSLWQYQRGAIYLPQWQFEYSPGVMHYLVQWQDVHS